MLENAKNLYKPKIEYTNQLDIHFSLIFLSHSKIIL